MAPVKVLTPQEAVAAWKKALPDTVVTTFNELVQKNFNGTSARLTESELYKALGKKDLGSSLVREQNWLAQVQEMYKEAGWKVTRRVRPTKKPGPKTVPVKPHRRSKPKPC